MTFNGFKKMLILKKKSYQLYSEFYNQTIKSENLMIFEKNNIINNSDLIYQKPFLKNYLDTENQHVF